ncbi:hypothetical protein WJX74_009233 [Apatococcus lobatus]|uniref:Cation/H+ exchanger transmembrane domain-containing protein n=2 Tax=Apatococcus TaxID=904362 RepID=A0AAW1RP42_9CHLO
MMQPAWLPNAAGAFKSFGNSLIAPNPNKTDPYVFCHAHNVSYSHPVDDKDHFNWCTVPGKTYDAVLFAGFAVLCACLLQGKFSALWVLLAGGLCQGLAVPFNLGPVRNALALWLGIEPADLFLYIFLPPMLLDAAVRIDYFLLKKVLPQVLAFAFLLVSASTVAMIPVLQYMFGLAGMGWTWQHAALFAAMLGSTDCVAVSAVLKAAGGPEELIVLLEGESLFNDATSIVLFEVFFEMVKTVERGEQSGSTIAAETLTITSKIVYMAAGGLAIGIAFGLVTVQLLKALKWRGLAQPPQELSLSVAMAYLCFYAANGPGKVSGPIAVVCFGLFGAATSRWDMTVNTAASSKFDTFWDTLSYGMNGLVFFFAGVSSVNFFIRSSEELVSDKGQIAAIWTTFWRLPLVWIALYAVRGICIAALNYCFQAARKGIPWNATIFLTFGGLRGAISLILAQLLVTQQEPAEDVGVTAQIALWTSGIVLLTLLFNAPFIPKLLDWTGLVQLSPIKAKMHAKAVRAFIRHTKTLIQDLQNNEDELFRGVDWVAVARYVDFRKDLRAIAGPAGLGREEEGPMLLDGQSRKRSVQSSARGGSEDVNEEMQHLLEGSTTSSGADEGGDGHQDEDDQRRRYKDQENTFSSGLSTDEEDEGQAWAESHEYDPTDSGTQPETGSVIDKEAANEMLKEHHSEFNADIPFYGHQYGHQNTNQVDQQSNNGRGQDGASGRSPGGPSVYDAANPSFAPTPDAEASSLPDHPDEMNHHIVDMPSSSAQHQASAGARSPENGTMENRIPDSDQDATGQQEPEPEEESWLQRSSRLLLGQTSGTKAPDQPVLGQLKSSKQDSHRLVLPLPIIKPPLVSPGSSDRKQQEKSRALPEVHWAVTDFQQLAEQRRQQRGSLDSRRSLQGASRQPSQNQNAWSNDVQNAMSMAGSDDEGDEIDEENKEVELVEARVRLMAGLKNYFYEKRSQGLISAQGIRMLDMAVNACMDEPAGPLSLWARIEKEACGGLMVRTLASTLFALRRFIIASRSYHPKWLSDTFLHKPALLLAEFVGGLLSAKMLAGVEVAVEFWLALGHKSSQPQWTHMSDKSDILPNEVAQERAAAWHFIIDMEVEAPARFQAIQSYRATMALLRQQILFVETLRSSGMVEEHEAKEMLDPIDERERTLSQQGAVWRSPPLTEVVRNLPCLRTLPGPLFNALLERGSLVTYKKGEVIWRPDQPSAELDERHGGKQGFQRGVPCKASGIYIIMAGLARTTYTLPGQASEDCFLGGGSVVGLLAALLGERMPGAGPVEATGNALGQGPVVFYLPQDLVSRICSRGQPPESSRDEEEQDGIDRARSKVSPQAVGKLREDLFRLCALHIMERLKGEVGAAAMAHFQHLAIARARRQTQRHIAKQNHANAAAEEKSGRKVQDVQPGAVSKAAGDQLNEALGASLSDLTQDQEEQEMMGSHEDHGTPSSQEELSDEALLASMDANRFWKEGQRRAGDVLAKLKQDLLGASLVQLKPNQVFRQSSSLVLLKGNLHVTAQASKPPPSTSQDDSGEAGASGRKLTATIEHSGPCVLPWLWEVVAHGEDVILVPQPINLLTGSDGAWIMVTESAFEDDGPAVAEAEQGHLDRLALSTDTVQVAAPNQAGQGSAREVQITLK